MSQKRSPRSGSRRRPNDKFVTTRSGKVLKVHRSIGEKWMVLRESKARRKVIRMQGLPKSRIKRFLWRIRPSHLKEYWFSRDGGIMALKIVGITIVSLFILTMAVFAYFRKDLPKITDISGGNLGGSISYYDRTGQHLLWQDYDAIKRVPVKGSDISQFIKDATIATEDRNFYNEHGFDLKGIMRAAINNTIKNGSTQGGSTITQQLVKLTQNWTQQRTFTRKVKELILAVELERTYTKDEILTGYLNAAPYGGIDYGVQAAASDYFQKSAKDLTLPEAAMLAAIPKSPSVYSPYNKEYFNRQAFLGRYGYVLDSMVETGKITKKQANEAKKFDILATVKPQSTKYAGIKSPYFVLAAKNEIVTKWASKGPGSNKVGGWKVVTTLDMNLQKIADEQVQKNRANALSHGADEEALVAEDVQTGQVVALVGGTDFNNESHGKINYAQWNISPGSSFKPYDYTTLINSTTNSGAGSVLYDVQQALPGYPCTVKGAPPPRGNSNCLQNYDFRYPGAESLRYALGGSRNVPAVKAMLSSVPGNTTASVNKTISTANSLMGVPGAYKCYNPGVDVNTATKADETQCYGAAAIGDGAYLHLDQHVNGLASLARMGVAFPSTYVLKIYDAKSDTKPFYEWKQPKQGDENVKQAVRPEAAYIVNNMASDPNASYLPAGFYKWHNYNGWRTAIKTGTTNNGFDGLMMAWNTKYAVGSWVGYHTRNQALSGAMEYSTTPLTRGFMTAALDALRTKPTNWTEPSGIQHLPAYVVRSHIGIGSVEPSPSTDIFPSWYKGRSASTQSITIDKVSGKKATSCTPELAKQKLGGNSAANNFSSDIFYPPGAGASAATSTSPSESDDVHSCSDAKPVITVTPNSNPNGTYTLVAAATAGTHPFSDPKYPQYPGTITISDNGKTIKTCNLSGSAANCSITYTPSSGSHTINALVTDSVLYSASDSKSFTKKSSPSSSLNFTSISTESATWNGGSGQYTVRNSSGTIICGPTLAKNCSFIDPKPSHNETVTISDTAGNSATGKVQ